MEFAVFTIPILDVYLHCGEHAWSIPFSPDMEHFHHRLMAKGLSHGKAVLAMWAMAFCCSLVAIASAFGKGDKLFAIFVFFGLGGFILLRYLGYFRFEFFGEGLSTLMQDRKSTKSVEQAFKEAEDLVANSIDLEFLEECLSKAAEGMQFQQATISLFHEDGRLGSDLNLKNPPVGKSFGVIKSSLDIFQETKILVEFPIAEETLLTARYSTISWMVAVRYPFKTKYCSSIRLALNHRSITQARLYPFLTSAFSKFLDLLDSIFFLLPVSKFLRAFTILSPKAKRRMLLLLPVIIVGMALETLSVGMVLPALGILMSETYFEQFPALSPVLKYFGRPDHGDLVFWGLAGLATVFFVKNIFLFFQVQLQGTFVYSAQREISLELFRRYLAKDYRFHWKQIALFLLEIW